MPTPFRLEIYNRDFSLDTWSLCSEPSYRMDYLTLEEWSVTAIGTLSAKRGNYVQVVQGNKIKYQGVLTNIDTGTEEGVTTMYVRPLQSLLDFDVYLPTLQIPNSIENLLKIFIEWGRKNNEEPSGHLQGLVVQTTTSTTGNILTEEANIINFWDCAVQALKQHGIVIKAILLTAQKQIQFIIGKQTETATIEADLPNIIGKTISLQESNGTPNCCLIANKENPGQYAWFGNTTANNGIWTVKEIQVKEDEDFLSKAQEQANALVVAEELDNSIEISVKENDNIVTAKEIGTRAEIIADNRAIPAVLTAVEIHGNIKVLTFGVIRLDLTRQLILQRRKMK